MVFGGSDPPQTLPGTIAFGTAEDIHQEDPQTTNIYIDDHATRAAPYTLQASLSLHTVMTKATSKTRRQ